MIDFYLLLVILIQTRNLTLQKRCSTPTNFHFIVSKLSTNLTTFYGNLKDGGLTNILLNIVQKNAFLIQFCFYTSMVMIYRNYI